MIELNTYDIAFVSGAGHAQVTGHVYEKCVAGYALGGSLFGAAIGVGVTFLGAGVGRTAGFGIGATLGGVAGAYFCD